MGYFMIALFILMSACVHYPYSVDALKAEGYKRADMVAQAYDGETRTAEAFAVWWKETLTDGRRLNLCIVPRINSAGYTWRSTITVDDRPVWSHDTGGFGKPSILHQGVSCVTSDQLPSGSTSWNVGFTYWQ